MSHRFFRYYTFVGHYLLLYGRTNNVVKAGLRSALPLARARKPSLHGSHRSTQTSASVDADIRIGRRRHPHRSAQTSASVGADVLIGGYGIPAIPTQPPPRHPQPSPRSHMYAADCVGIAGMLYPPTDCVGIAGMLYPPIDCVGIARMLYPPIDCVGMAGMPYPPIDSGVLLLCLTFEHKLVSDVQIAVEIQSGVSVVEVGAGLAAIEEVERTGWRYVQTFG